MEGVRQGNGVTALKKLFLNLYPIPSVVRGDQPHGWEIGAIARGITREEGHALDYRVCADIEVGQGASPSATTAAILDKALCGEKAGLPGQGFTPH